MDEQQAAQARSRAYRLFGQLFSTGPTPDIQPALAALPELAETFDASIDADEAAADHHHLFGFNVFPHAGLFLDAPAQLGGPAADTARRLYRDAGYHPPTAIDAPDHVAAAFGALAFLTAAEADAWHDARPDEAARMQHHQRRLFDAYLLGWLPAFTFAVARQNHPFYSALADLTHDLALDHRAMLGEDNVAPPPLLPEPPPLLPEPPPLLDDPSAGLRDIADFLTTPAHCGFYLSRDDLGRLGRSLALPHGFGHRRLLLENLFRAAAGFEHLPALLDALREQVAVWQTFYASLPSPLAAPWQARLAGSLALLDTITQKTTAGEG